MNARAGTWVAWSLWTLSALLTALSLFLLVQNWALARVAVPGVWLFTVLTLLATLIHIDLFRMDGVFGWAWLIVYLVVPLGYGVFCVRQLRATHLAKPLYRRGCASSSVSKPPSC